MTGVSRTADILAFLLFTEEKRKQEAPKSAESSRLCNPRFLTPLLLTSLIFIILKGSVTVLTE